MSSSKQVVVITGANQGIGWEAAKAIVSASPDFHVVIGSRSVERGQKAVSALTSLGIKGSVSLVQLDVNDDRSVANAAKKIGEVYGHVDALINNAGIVVQDESMRYRLTATLATNTVAPALVTDAFLPLLKKSQSPRLVYVSSSMGSMTEKLDSSSAYSAIPNIEYRMSKAAINMLAACHHVHFQEFRIKVFCFNPGFCATNLMGEEQRQRRVERGAQSAEIPAASLAKIIAGKLDHSAGKFVDDDGEKVVPW